MRPPAACAYRPSYDYCSRFRARAPTTAPQINTSPKIRTPNHVAATPHGPARRNVRCAACKHSWYQHPPVEEVGRDLVGASETPQTQTAPAPPPSWVAETPAPRRADEQPASVSEARIERRPRRNPARLWTAGAIAAGLLMLAASAVLMRDDIAATGLGRRLGLLRPPSSAASASPAAQALKLQITELPQARVLANGDIVQEVAGRIENPTDRSFPIPPLRAVMLGADNAVVYSWVIPPPARELPPVPPARASR